MAAKCRALYGHIPEAPDQIEPRAGSFEKKGNVHKALKDKQKQGRQMVSLPN